MNIQRKRLSPEQRSKRLKRKRKIVNFLQVTVIAVVIFAILAFNLALIYIAFDLITSVIGWLDRN